MNYIEPINQLKLFGLEKYLLELIRLYKAKIFPNKILLSGQKGIGKSTLAYHFINYVLSENQDYKYDLKSFQINPYNPTFKTIINKSNINLININNYFEKKSIDINQIRNLINKLNKSSLNDKPRFVLIDNIEFLNLNSVNALLKIIEEPNFNVYFILINNNKKVFSTLLSRCINFKIKLSNEDSIKVSRKLLGENLESLINFDFINYYFTPGNLYNLIKFADENDYDLSKLDLKNFLKDIIKENYYKKHHFIKFIIFDLIEFYFRKINESFSSNIHEKYSYFINRISDTKTFNLDEDSLLREFEQKVLNG